MWLAILQCIVENCVCSWVDRNVENVVAHCNRVAKIAAAAPILLLLESQRHNAHNREHLASIRKHKRKTPLSPVAPRLNCVKIPSLRHPHEIPRRVLVNVTCLAFPLLYQSQPVRSYKKPHISPLSTELFLHDAVL